MSDESTSNKYDYLSADIREVPFIKAYLIKADKYLEAIGYTEHGLRHANIVSKSVQYILTTLDYPKDTVLLAGIAAYLHDIGNLVSRKNHGITSALMAQEILKKMGLPLD